jgi:hypothetical protein
MRLGDSAWDMSLVLKGVEFFVALQYNLHRRDEFIKKEAEMHQSTWTYVTSLPE